MARVPDIDLSARAVARIHSSRNQCPWTNPYPRSWHCLGQGVKDSVESADEGACRIPACPYISFFLGGVSDPFLLGCLGELMDVSQCFLRKKEPAAFTKLLGVAADARAPQPQRRNTSRAGTRLTSNTCPRRRYPMTTIILIRLWFAEAALSSDSRGALLVPRFLAVTACPHLGALDWLC